jgi:hypothetical protein
VLRHYSNLLHATRLGWAVAGGIPWLWPLLATLHLVGMALLIGCAGTMDLRLLGVGKDLPLRPMRGLLPWARLGFAIALTTGIALYAGNPEQYQNGAFFFKMLFMVLAGLNDLLFYATGLSQRVDAVRAGQDVPMRAKLTAVASLVLWFGVMFWGRMLTFFQTT